MKRIITLFGILCTIAGPGKAQTITNANYIDSCTFMGANSFQPIVSLSSPTSLTACKLETNFGDGSKIDTTTISMGGSTSYFAYPLAHSYTTVGSYSVKHVLICGSNRLDSLTKSATISCSYMGGALYNDANSNCVYNSSENQIGGTARIEVDSAGVKIDTIYAWGYWWYKPRATTSTVYKFKLLSSPGGFTNTCPSTGTITYTYSPTLTAVTGLDFGFQCSSTPTFDYILYYSRALRGASSPGVSFIRLYASNTSCHTGSSTVTLNVSPKYTINTSGITPTPTSVSGNTVTWTLTSLSVGYKILYVPLTPLSTTNNGDTACNSATITPLSGDANPSNNTAGGCDSVRASWDPNEKSVSSNGVITAGSVLNYTINFENLGNDTAFNIHVQDTLSQYLDVNSFELLGSTHRVVPYIYQASGKNIIKFDFPGINLEDKNAPDRNKGQVRFSLRLAAGLAPGTVIQNRAGIYFDGNPVVLTNYAYSKTIKPESVPGINAQDNIKVFPNPAGQTLNIQVIGDGWDEAFLTNAVGQVIAHTHLFTGTNSLNIAKLPSGIYYLQAKGSAGSVSEKIEKL